MTLVGGSIRKDRKRVFALQQLLRQAGGREGQCSSCLSYWNGHGCSFGPGYLQVIHVGVKSRQNEILVFSPDLGNRFPGGCVGGH